MQKCLVLGAGGFIGKNICKSLVDEYHVIAFDRFIPAELENISPNIEFIVGDFVNMKDFTNVLHGVDKVIHLISTTIPSEETAHIDREVTENVVPTVRLLEGMVKENVKEIIFSSSGGTVYGDSGEHKNQVGDALHPICSYGVQKKVIEAYLEFYGLRYGINYKVMRISNPYGIGQDLAKTQGVIPIFVHRLLNNMPICVYGDSVRDYIAIPDLIKGIMAVLKYNGKQHVFNIGSGQVYTLREVISIIEQKVGAKFETVEYQDFRQCDVEKSILDVEESNEALGWRAEIGLEQGIEMVVNMYKEK